MPPEVALLFPELEDGALPVLKPLELLLEEFELELFEELELLDPVPVLVEPVPVEPVLVEPEPADLLDVEVPEVPDVLVAAWCVEPGRTRATAPAAATPARPVAAVIDRTFARPRCLTATAFTIGLRFIGTSSAVDLEALCKLLLWEL